MCVADIWSLGVILYMLVCGVPPFQETNDSETLVMILDCRYCIPKHISDDCKEWVVEGLWGLNQSEGSESDLQAEIVVEEFLFPFMFMFREADCKFLFNRCAFH